MNHCFMSCIHRALKSAALRLKREFCGSASNTKADSERERAPRNDNTTNRLSLHSTQINISGQSDTPLLAGKARVLL